jgi:hypothetical protein
VGGGGTWASESDGWGDEDGKKASEAEPGAEEAGLVSAEGERHRFAGVGNA